MFSVSSYFRSSRHLSGRVVLYGIWCKWCLLVIDSCQMTSELPLSFGLVWRNVKWKAIPVNTLLYKFSVVEVSLQSNKRLSLYLTSLYNIDTVFWRIAGQVNIKQKQSWIFHIKCSGLKLEDVQCKQNTCLNFNMRASLFVPIAIGIRTYIMSFLEQQLIERRRF